MQTTVHFGFLNPFGSVEGHRGHPGWPTSQGAARGLGSIEHPQALQRPATWA